MAAALLALPWFWNTGARFLMPALPFLALALALALPRQALWACVALQAVACWPQVVGLYHREYTWRLERIPWRAALRIQPEQAYLSSLQPAYRVARLVQDNTQPGERIFSLIAAPAAYTDREILVFWHSAQAVQLHDTLRVAVDRNNTLFDVRAEWTPHPMSALRIRMPQASPVEWVIGEIQLFSGDYRIFGSPQWQLQAWPNVWELPLAFDENQATRWRTWDPIRAGMFVEVDFDRADAERRGDDFAHRVLSAAVRFLRARARWVALVDGPAGGDGKAAGKRENVSHQGGSRRGIPLHPGEQRQRWEWRARRRHGGARGGVGFGEDGRSWPSGAVPDKVNSRRRRSGAASLAHTTSVVSVKLSDLFRNGIDTLAIYNFM
jgi:hypothetical protein